MLYPVNEIYKIILKYKNPFETMFIGIDGGACAGKTELSKLLYNIMPFNVSIVHMDDFYRPASERKSDAYCIDGQIDFQRLIEQVFIPLSENKTAEYQVYDIKTDTFTETKRINSEDIVIVEGDRAISDVFHRFYNYNIWVGTPHEIRAERAFKRGGEDYLRYFKEFRVPSEEYYIGYQEPLDYADMIIDGSGLIADISKKEVDLIMINNVYYYFDNKKLL